MPLLLWGDLQWWTFLVASLITMLLAGIDNIGIMIEVRCPAACCLISDVRKARVLACRRPGITTLLQSP